MKILKNICSVLLFLLPMMFSGCAENQAAVEPWINESYEGLQYRKILVVGAAEKITFKNLLEGELVTQLENHKVVAIPAYEILPFNNILTRDLVLTAGDKSEIEAILIVSLVEMNRKTDFDSIADTDPFGYYEALHNNLTSSGKTAAQKEQILFLKASLYDAKSEQLIWSVVPRSGYRYNMKSIGSAVNLIINQLNTAGMI